jgi:hypothetical protein
LYIKAGLKHLEIAYINYYVIFSVYKHQLMTTAEPLLLLLIAQADGEVQVSHGSPYRNLKC